MTVRGSLPSPGCRKRRLKGGLGRKLMLIFCIGIVHTNVYNSISCVSARMQYLYLFDTVSHAHGCRHEGHPVIKTLHTHH